MSSNSHEKGKNYGKVGTKSSDDVNLNIYKDDIVISGMSGRFPESDTVEEFKKNLFDGIDMVTEDGKRWPAGILGIPPRSGKLKNLHLFDSSFFGINENLANAMDPQVRILLEVVHEAIVDAGVNPQTLRGSNIAVFVGCATRETETHRSHDPNEITKWTFYGCSGALMANYISYAFDFKGPSFMMDVACSSSFLAIHQALMAIRMGQCESAIVAASNLVLRPNTMITLQNIGVLSPRGKCCSFDASADGYVRSEAVAAIFLQKSCHANRIYASIVHAKVSSDGRKSKGIAVPSRASKMNLIEDVYKEINVKTTDVSFLECHATGTRVGDAKEVNAITDVFCQNRHSPLLITSTRTNMGHPEAASGLCSLVKIILCMESGLIPPCLNYKNPSPRLTGLHDGRLKVITKITPMKGQYVGVNSFGIGGTNAHILVKSNPKVKKPVIEDGLPRLVCVSGRTEAAVENMLDKIIASPRDNEFYALIHQIHEQNIPHHNYRGFAILTDRPRKQVMKSSVESRPIWYAFSGMGSQWAGMARDLIQFEVFRELANKVADILKTESFDLMNILTSTDESIFNNIINSIISITAMQVILVDLLKLMGIVPNGMIGHSIGEIGCAYADGALTLEEAILISFWRGKCLHESKLPERAMAVVGLSLEEVTKRAPTSIEIAYHNYIDVIVISGPYDLINKFVNHLNEEKIFARHIPTAGIAFHSSYIAEVGPTYLRKLERIITNPKPRSSKWISTSLPQEKWNSPIGLHSSAAYHLNNFLKPVLFFEALQKIPPNAIIIEIGPHALLQSVIKRALGSDGVTFGLMDKRQPNNLEFIFNNIGRLYIEGGQPNLRNIYPNVEFPVSRGTSMIQSLVEWDHSITYNVPYFNDPSGCFMNEMTIIKVDPVKDPVYFSQFIEEGRVLFPAAGYITLLWRMLAKIRGKQTENLPIIIEDMQFLRTIIVPSNEAITFSITILQGSGSFEICESGSVVVKGHVLTPDDIENQFLSLPQFEMISSLQIEASEIYSELKRRGYNYSEELRGIKSSDDHGICGEIYVSDNFVRFVDSMLQFIFFHSKKREFKLLNRLQRIVIDPNTHKRLTQSLPADKAFLPLYNCKDLETIFCGGIKITGLRATLGPQPQPKNTIPLIRKYVFVPFDTDQQNLPEFEMDQALTVVFNIVVENSDCSIKPKIVVVQKSIPINDSLALRFLDVIKSAATIKVNFMVASSVPEFVGNNDRLKAQLKLNSLPTNTVNSDYTLIAMVNATSNSIEFAALLNSVRYGGFILSVNDSSSEHGLEMSDIKRIMKFVVEGKTLLLYRKINVSPPLKVISVGKNSQEWIDEIRQSKDDEKKLIVSLEHNRGILELIKKTNKKNLRSLFILDREFEDNSIESSVITQQLKKDLVQNVYKNSVWGSYQYLPLEKRPDLRLSKYAYVKTSISGDLSSLQWVEEPFTKELSNSESEFYHVYFTSLNTRDFQVASGQTIRNRNGFKQLSKDKILGLEFSGRDSNGERVMGITRGCLSTHILSRPNLLWKVPEKWTLEQASSVPLSYATAYYCLFLRGGLRPGESILIHNGAHSVCQAAIAISLHAECTVYATVNDKVTESFLKKKFSMLTTINSENIQDFSLEQKILKLTNGKGVNIVLNSETTDTLTTMAGCLQKNNGRFLQIMGKLNIAENFSLDFLTNATIFLVHFNVLLDSDDENHNRMRIVELMKEGIENGAVTPLGREIFSEDNLEQAFKILSMPNKASKVTVKIRDEEPQIMVKSSSKYIQTTSTVRLQSKKTYILIGGFDETGVELVYWLISRGASKIAFATHDTVTNNGYQSFHAQQWTHSRVDVLFYDYNCSTESGTNSLLETANSMGPIGGIFYTADVFRDDNAISDATILSSISIIKNLDYVTKRNCPSLDHFVIFSASTTHCDYNNKMLVNFVWTSLEKICETRKEAGLPSVTILWENVETIPLACLDNLLQRSDPMLVVSMAKESEIRQNF